MARLGAQLHRAPHQPYIRGEQHTIWPLPPRYYLDSLDSIDIWYLVVSINWTAPGPRPLLLDIVYPRLFLSG